MRFVRLFGLLALLVLASAAQAGTLHPAVEKAIAETPADQPISVIVSMSEQAPIADLNQSLKVRSATRRERHETVITALQEAQGSQAALKADLEIGLRSGAVIGYTSYWLSNMMVVYALPAVIEQIAARPDVDIVELNFTPEIIDPVETPAPDLNGETGGIRGIGVPPGIRAIRAPEVWYGLGFNGQGRIIASLDTGVDGNHPALNTRWRGYGGQNPWQECWLDVLGGGTSFPTDGNGHGTHVTGTMAGMAPDDTVGVAWGAQWIASNAINQGVGSGFDNDIITCLQWFADPDGNPGTVDDVPDVVQNSWRINEGFGGGYTDCDTRWWAAMDNCEASGVVLTWSAGNEGSGSQTIGSPADRATTLTNAFSVGAVDATNYNWPYPIASFSSRGPTGCNVPADHKIKPEVVGPGVSVYSSVPGGGYSSGYSGTSMSGPHVAGIVALIRQANPNLDVDTIKDILMQTSRDLGSAGEENIYGWGFVDAQAAVLAAMSGFGELQGYVRNASFGNAPLPGALVHLVDTGYNYTTDGTGYYAGSAAAATYTARATLAGFAPQVIEVTLESNEVTVQNFSLTDIAGPAISGVTGFGATTDQVGPYPVQATVTDYSTVTEVKIYHRVNGGTWSENLMSGLGGVYTHQLTGMPAGTRIDFYLQAWDGVGLNSVDPFGAPAAFHTLFITEEIYSYTVEDPIDPNWTLGVPGDDATTGIWVRVDPVGTQYNGQQIQPEDDHTPNPGVLCFVTGNGSVGGAPGDNDVDDGCTTLLSPVFDLSDTEVAFIRYWRWWGQGGNAVDDEFIVDISSNGGATWVPVERVPGNDNVWRQVSVDIASLVDLTDQVVMRFVACDLGAGGLVEAAIDDVVLEVFAPNSAGAPEIVRPFASLSQNAPNPFRTDQAVTQIRFSLSNPAEANLQIFDASGRMVRDLLNAPLQSGVHSLDWDGRDDQGRPVGSGIYFYRLKAGAFEQSRQMTILR